MHSAVPLEKGWLQNSRVLFMAKRRKIEAITGEFELPEPIIQHIQSFLSAKRAAQTTVLSKSWFEAWLTRPIFDFDESQFPRPRTNVRTRESCFWEFVKKTIQRYEESNLKIESLRLHIENDLWHVDDHGYDFVNKLILRSLKMGATHINLRINDCKFVLSPDVFGAEKLVGLSVEGCTIDLGQMEDPRVNRCSGLKFLSFSGVCIERIERIPNIISSFSLIEKLSLSDIYDCTEYVSDRQYPLNLHKLHNLRSLTIYHVEEIDPLFFGDLSSKFPSLKDLNFLLFDIVENMLISSRSLERLSFGLSTWHGGSQKKKRVTFDVPSIRVFKFEGSIFPSFSFKSTSREWESRLSITRRHELSMSWFLKLNKFLLELSPSKIHLSLHVHSNRSFNYEVEHIEGLRKPVLENLTMDTDGLPSLTCYALFDALFRLCRPKIITQYVPRKSSFSDDFFCKTLVLEMDGKCSSRCVRGLHDLQKVYVQIFDKDVAVWQDLPWKEFLNASASRKHKQKMCFHLRWKQ